MVPSREERNVAIDDWHCSDFRLRETRIFWRGPVEFDPPWLGVKYVDLDGLRTRGTGVPGLLFVRGGSGRSGSCEGLAFALDAGTCGMAEGETEEEDANEGIDLAIERLFVRFAGRLDGTN